MVLEDAKAVWTLADDDAGDATIREANLRTVATSLAPNCFLQSHRRFCLAYSSASADGVVTTYREIVGESWRALKRALGAPRGSPGIPRGSSGLLEPLGDPQEVLLRFSHWQSRPIGTTVNV